MTFVVGMDQGLQEFSTGFRKLLGQEQVIDDHEIGVEQVLQQLLARAR